MERAIKTSNDDANMIVELRNDLTKVYSLFESSKEKEEKQRHIILNLKSHIENLNEQLHQMSNEKYGQSNTLGQVLAEKDKLSENLNRLEVEKNVLGDQLKDHKKKIEECYTEIK